MLNESLLDSPEALARADARGLLRGAAEAGARVRTGLRQATESGLAGLKPDGRPRAVLVAGPGPATSGVAGLLGALTNGGVPVTLLSPTGSLAASGALRWSLPGWAGPLDLLLLLTPDGTEPGLVAMVDQAYRRGCTVVTVAPESVPLAEAVGETRGLAVTLPPGPYEIYESPDIPGNPAEDPSAPAGGHLAAAPGTFWGLLTPLLVLVDRLGLTQTGPDDIQKAADRLDEVAERCGPATAPYSNPGKSLAAELSGALPLLWSEGGVASAAARRWAATFAALPGRPALAAELPEAMTAHGALLAGTFAGGSAEDDFFRDRVEEPEAMRARIVLLRERAPDGDSATVAARDLAYAHDSPLSELEAAEGSSALEAAAELIATADFAAVYLALADSDSPWA